LITLIINAHPVLAHDMVSIEKRPANSSFARSQAV